MQINAEVIRKYGFASKHESRLINLLKFIDVIDDSWNKRDKIVAYSKLPRGFLIPTPVGDYNPDWAISFTRGTVKHIYFMAETKGSMSSMKLSEIEFDGEKNISQSGITGYLEFAV